jgi:hypothetical protein
MRQAPCGECIRSAFFCGQVAFQPTSSAASIMVSKARDMSSASASASTQLCGRATKWPSQRVRLPVAGAEVEKARARLLVEVLHQELGEVRVARRRVEGLTQLQPVAVEFLGPIFFRAVFFGQVFLAMSSSLQFGDEAGRPVFPAGQGLPGGPARLGHLGAQGRVEDGPAHAARQAVGIPWRRQDRRARPTRSAMAPPVQSASGRPRACASAAAMPKPSKWVASAKRSAVAYSCSSAPFETAPRKATRRSGPAPPPARRDHRHARDRPAGRPMRSVHSRSVRRPSARSSTSCPLRGISEPTERMRVPGPPEPPARGAGSVPGSTTPMRDGSAPSGGRPRAV